MKTIGIIGGLGPMATVYYLELITRMTDAARDQEHPRVLLASLPDTPDRTSYILWKKGMAGRAEDPFPVMLKAALGLWEMGAELLSVPCITAHYFYDDLVRQLDIPVLHLPRCVAQDAAAKGIRQVGLLATSGTIQSQVLEAEFAAAGIRVIVPDAARQEQVMQIIYEQLKKGAPIQWESFYDVALSLQEQGAEKLILGCTELPLLRRNMAEVAGTKIEHVLARDCVDVLEVLAQHVIREAGVPLRAEYRDVIQ